MNQDEFNRMLLAALRDPKIIEALLHAIYVPELLHTNAKDILDRMQEQFKRG